MDHYQDIQLLADPEFGAPQLMNALFAKLHRTLVQRQSEDIGVSFPGLHRKGTGTVLRLHGSTSALQALSEQPWLAGMRDHVTVADIAEVPATAGHQVVRRVQAKSNPERLRRRQMKRQGWTAEQALAAIPDHVAETLKLPFLTIRSQSTGQTFHLFIDQHTVDQPMPGKFNAYGLSTSASLPQF